MSDLGIVIYKTEMTYEKYKGRSGNQVIGVKNEFREIGVCIILISQRKKIDLCFDFSVKF